MAVGDSFTFGRGVSLEDTWPFLLEKELNNKFKDKKFEVLNFGRPGFAPYDYLEIVKKYLPIYKSDYLLIGILEGEDVFPLIPAQTKQKKSLDTNRTKEVLDVGKNKKAIPNILKQLYPHLFALISLNKPIEVSETFANRVREYLRSLDEEGIKKWDLIDPFYKKLFLEGKLQSGLLELMIAFRKFCNSGCFYQYDGHMNQKGYKLLATSIAEYFSQMIANTEE